MLIGTIDFYHFIPLWLTLTFAGGHKVSAKQNAFLNWSGDIWHCFEAIQAEHPDTTFEWHLLDLVRQGKLRRMPDLNKDLQNKTTTRYGTVNFLVRLCKGCNKTFWR